MAAGYLIGYLYSKGIALRCYNYYVSDSVICAKNNQATQTKGKNEGEKRRRSR
jgi:hypothetical protein